MTAAFAAPALAPAMAHLLELPNKIGLPAETYLAVQQIYRGWEALRTQWEYSHAASALLNLAALVSLIVALLLSCYERSGPTSRSTAPGSL